MCLTTNTPQTATSHSFDAGVSEPTKMNEVQKKDSSGSLCPTAPVDSDSSTDSFSFDQLSEPPSTKSLKKTVSFGNLEELCFAVEKGDPGVFEMAYPLQLSTECVSETTHTVDDYEETRGHLRRKSDDLRTSNSEERRQIIKASSKALKEYKKAKKRTHRRNNSIGNGQINRLTAAPEMPKPKPIGRESSAPASFVRPELRRQNSIGNGEMTRDKRRNRVQDFLKRMSFTKK